MPEPADVQVEIDDRVMLARPDYRCVVVLATGTFNAESDEESSALLADAEQQLRGRGLARASDDPHIAAWRSAFSGFGAKPSKYPSSAEALAARVLKGGALPRINVLVDLYRRGCMARRRRRDLPPLELAPGHPHPPHRDLAQRVLRLRSARRAHVERLDDAASDLEAGLRRRWPHAAIERRHVDCAETRAI